MAEAPTKHPKILYAMLRHTEDGAKLRELLSEHLEWMRGNEKDGRIFLSGPTEPTAGRSASRPIIRPGRAFEPVSLAKSSWSSNLHRGDPS